jgi:hypothetical protein
MAKQYDNVVVAARPSSEFLYEFATEYIGFKAIAKTTYIGRAQSKLPEHWGNDGDIFDPKTIYVRLHRKMGNGIYLPPGVSFRKLAGGITNKVADVLCAFRSGQDDKTYPIGQARVLVNMLMLKGYTVACYGGKDNYYVDGTADIRGWKLEDQCAALSSAACAIGHSSGTMHLASLCECPHVTWHVNKPWLSHQSLGNRYEKLWNPFDTPVRYIGTGEPKPAHIIKAMEEML